MSNLRQAAERALDALEDIFGKNKVDVGAINALRAALDEPEWVVVAYVSDVKGGEVVIEPLNRASCLPVGTALCAHIQTVKEARLS